MATVPDAQRDHVEPRGAPLMSQPWEVRYAGRFRRHSRPAPGVWAAETVTCPACGAADGPWTVACEGSRTTLTCTCGAAHGDHGLAPSEILLVLPETG